MDIRKRLREELIKPKRKYSYGCVMANVVVKEDVWKGFQDKVDDEDIYHGPEGDAFGREWDPHTTILYGIHEDVSDEDVEALIDKVKDIKAEIERVSIFENKEFDVLKFDVKSKDLHRLNKMFKELPHTTEYPNYHPHMTIAYLKNGAGKKYLEVFKDFETFESDINKLIYSKPDGKKKNYSI